MDDAFAQIFNRLEALRAEGELAGEHEKFIEHIAAAQAHLEEAEKAVSRGRATPGSAPLPLSTTLMSRYPPPASFANTRRAGREYRRFQFSLRQLMVGTALICAAAVFWRVWRQFDWQRIWLFMFFVALFGAAGFISGRVRAFTLIGNIICGLVFIGVVMAMSRL